MKNTEVVIIGGLHHNTLGVIRSLGENGISRSVMHILIVGDSVSENNFISKSKYVNSQQIGYTDSYDYVVPWLNKLAANNMQKVIICCSDGAAKTVISCREQLSDLYRTPTTRMDITQLMDKSIQGELAVESGLKIPVSRVVSIKDIANWDIFPCIIKPLNSVTGGGKNDIRISNSRTELIEALRSAKSDAVQVQQYISKKMEYQLIGCSLDGGNIIIIPGFTRIVRQPLNTNTGYLEYSSIDRLDIDMGSVKKLIKTIGYSGLFSIEFIRDKDNNDYFLEINMRNDGNAYCVQTAGVNLPYIWYYYEINNCLPEIPLTISKSVWFIPDYNDLKVALKEESLFAWIRDFFKADSHSIYNAKDIKPFIYELGHQVFKRIKH